MDNLIFEHKTTIPYTETDMNKNLKISALMGYFQNAATEQLKDMGFSPAYLYSKNIAFLLSKLKIAIYRSPRAEENIIIKTWPKSIKGVAYNRDFIVCDENGIIIAEALSIWTAVNIIERKILRPSFVESDVPMPQMSQFSASIGKIERIVTPSDMNYSFTKNVRYSDIDTNRHMNNTVYAEIISDSIPEIITGKRVNNINISFRIECQLGDDIDIFTAFENGVYFVKGLNKNNRVTFESTLTVTDKEYEHG